jgi:hypothetical protein
MEQQTDGHWRNWIKWGLPPLIWGSLAVLSTTLSYSIYRLENRDVSFWRVAWWQSSAWLLWALMMPLVLWLGRRYRLEKAGLRRVLPVHLGAGLLLVLLHSGLVALLRYAAPLIDEPPVTLRDILFTGVFNLPINLLIYWAILGIGSAFDFYRRWQTEQLQSAQLKEQLALARLQALQMQLHPHFLFNTLHTIGTLVEDEPKLARRMIARLGDFLRLTLQENGTELVSLGRELEFTRTYLAIEELRFQDRLKVIYEIAPEALAGRVPYLILQPLVENAIRHGVAPRARRGRLELRAERSNGRLRIEVCDDGGRFVQTAEGVGLKNTRHRLAQLYGEQAALTLTLNENGQTVAAIEIPFAAKL